MSEPQGFSFSQYPPCSPAELASLCGFGIERARELLGGSTPTAQEAEEMARALSAWRDAHEADDALGENFEIVEGPSVRRPRRSPRLRRWKR